MENKPTEFFQEVVKYVVAELHVHAVLSGVVIASAHRIQESKAGIVASGVIVVGMWVTKRKYPHRFFHMIRLDRVYHRVKGRVVTIDRIDYVQTNNGFLKPAVWHVEDGHHF